MPSTKAPRTQAGEPAPWAPPTWDVADASAVQALVRGEAEPAQQQRALNWIINQAAATYDFQYRENDRAHAFMAGRAFVGQQVVKLLKINVAKFRQAP